MEKPVQEEKTQEYTVSVPVFGYQVFTKGEDVMAFDPEDGQLYIFDEAAKEWKTQGKPIKR